MNTRKRADNRPGIFLLVFFVMTVFSGMTAAQEPLPQENGFAVDRRPEYITMNFKEVDIQVLIRFISEITGRNFLIDPNVRGKVTILSPDKVTIDEAYQVFLSILDVHGFAAVPSGRVTKIVPAAEARAKGVETLIEGPGLSVDDKVITQLIPLRHADAAKLAAVLKPLVQKTGLLVPYPETNTLIIIDALSNIQRLLGIIYQLDVPGDRVIQVFVLEHARAADLGPKILSVLQETKAKGAAQQNLKIIPDKRTNSLILLASREDTANVRLLIEELDKRQLRPRENIHIYPLKNAVAEDLVSVLSEIPGKGETAEKGKAPVLSKDIQISADKATNTLVIIADPDEYQILRGIIEKLDVTRSMVYVEALIVEVTASKAMQLGVEWRAGNEYDGGLGGDRGGGVWLGGSTGPDRNIAGLAAGALPQGFVAGVIGRSISLGDVIFPSLGVFVRAIQSDDDFNILSTPQILTLDNEEAVIEVGQNIPFVTRVDQPNDITERAIQSFEYRDIGVTLKVTPHINQEGVVRLQVEQSVKSILERTALGGSVLAPTTTFRTARTVITVMDGETAVIGGLMEERVNSSKSYTPCLGTIPGLGWLFKHASEREEKTNLLVFLSPKVIVSPAEGRALYEEKESDIQEKIEELDEKKDLETLRRKAFE